MTLYVNVPILIKSLSYLQRNIFNTWFKRTCVTGQMKKTYQRVIGYELLKPNTGDNIILKF